MARKEPQSLEAEVNALGTAFINKESCEKICEELTPDMFYSEANKRIFEVISELRSKDTPVDVTTVVNELDKHKDLSKVGGIEYITEIVDSVATVANLQYYIDILFEKYILRTLINKSAEIQSDCFNEEQEVTLIVENAQRSVLAVNTNKIEKDIKSIQEVIVKAQAEIELLAKNGADITGIASGYYELDARTTGFHANELIILAGRPGMGKSALALNLATNMAINSKKSVAFFTLEMGAEQIVNRMFSSVGQIDSQKLRTGKLEHNDWKKLNEAMSELADTHIFIDDSAGITVGEMRNKCRKIKNSSTGLDIIFVDYLQLLSSSTKYAGNRVQEVSEVSRDLKKLAMELNVPVVALAQLSRGVERRDDKRPLMSDLKESGSIEQDADIVMFLYNDDYYSHKAKERPDLSLTELIISKHRSGSTGTVELMFEKNLSNFKNYIKGEEE
ncbi:MAG: replicative DNA helicase [Bacilli bacterium]